MQKELLAENVFIYKNVLDNPEKTLEMINNLKDSWEPGGIAKSRYDEYIKDNPQDEMRNVSVKYLPFESSEKDSDDLKFIVETINDAFDKCESDYLNNVAIDVNNHEGYQVVKYDIGQYFKDHIDATEEFPRKVSTVYYFNDNYEGGEIVFSTLNITVKPEKNSMIIFPSSETYKHAAKTITSGTKYAIVGFWR